MEFVPVVLWGQAVPIAVLIGGVLACPLGRRPGFRLRFGALLTATLLPDLVAIVGSVGEHTAGVLSVAGFAWGLVLAALSRFVLFHGRGPEQGPGNDEGGGPGPGDGRPTPPSPISPLPLPDAEPWSTRLRDHRPAPRTRRRRRQPARRRERTPSHLRSRLRLSSRSPLRV